MPWNEDGTRKTIAYKKSSGFKMKGWSPFTHKEFKLKVGKGQGSKRKGKYTVDPDAPGYKYGPGYEPPVSEEDKIPLKNHEKGYYKK